MSQDAAASSSVSAAQAYLSPARVLIRSFRQSRDNWKQKYRELKRVLKRCQVQVHDVRSSREAWRTRAESAEQRLRDLQTPAASSVAVESEKK